MKVKSTKKKLENFCKKVIIEDYVCHLGDLCGTIQAQRLICLVLLLEKTGPLILFSDRHFLLREKIQPCISFLILLIFFSLLENADDEKRE